MAIWEGFLANCLSKGLYSQGYCLLSGHVRLWELDSKEGRATKNWCLWTAVLEKTPESPSDSKEIKPVNLKWDQPWILTGRTDAEAEAPVFWSSDANRWLIGSLWCWERSRAGEEGIREWDGWTASPMQWTWTWANSRRWWGTGRPGVLQSMGSQRVGHDWATEQQLLILGKLISLCFSLLKAKVAIPTPCHLRRWRFIAFSWKGAIGAGTA